MKHILLFEGFTEKEDFSFLENVKDLLLEYADKYDLVETGTGIQISDRDDFWNNFHSRNGSLQCSIVEPFSKYESSWIEVIISIKDEKSAKQFFESGDDKKIFMRLEKFGYRPEIVRNTSNINYSLYYQFYIYR